MDSRSILAQLPYSTPFLFVDKILEVSENSITGEYTFSPDLDFYKGHFKDNPITPGVILTECMAQIGVVCLGIYLLNAEGTKKETPGVALSSSEIEYLKPVYPGEKVTVISEKQYFRFNKLKCKIKMADSEGNLVCKGVIAGMIIKG
ncbi:3-hydroxyacyl-ACP dehydratase FabZ family protein [Christiangramia forsetii]|uniref:(3R)-hydroxymyristoyl-[acyl-carrier-protein]dehydratase n=2 Tax=Christiangramia forsetii TaxID=411153 RepID=A0M1T6_CHRFK|nr:FabA/FabZ family ACP-dehydratase [Christiangramia forsetii]GGG45399.1 beta-hydroxyacyl-ACP dehydratase [Christiangramia forsetii]CAL66581.1 (3R)-hydroxymyristoyl-[acyl-carrier-protein]dehydratase [Christiangramia forsetii KT0803]